MSHNSQWTKSMKQRFKWHTILMSVFQCDGTCLQALVSALVWFAEDICTYACVSLSLVALACSSQHIKQDSCKPLSQPNRHTLTQTHRYLPCFCLKGYFGGRLSCLSDMTGAFAKTRPGLRGRFINSSLSFTEFSHLCSLVIELKVDAMKTRYIFVNCMFSVYEYVCVLPMGLIKQWRPLRPCL